MNMNTNISTITVAVIGLECSGKTAFVEKLYNPEFDIHNTVSTISFNSRIIIVENDNIGNIEVELTDISPIAINHMTDFINNKDCIILMYDLGSKQSFEYLEHIISILKIKPHKEQLFYLIGTKCDIHHISNISGDDIDYFMCENNIKCFRKIQSSEYKKLKYDFTSLVSIMYKDIKLSRLFRKHVDNENSTKDIKIYNNHNISTSTSSDMYNCCLIS